MSSSLALLDLSTPELIIILVIILLLFGSKKLPELSRSLGESLREAKNGLSEGAKLKDEVKSEINNTKKVFNAPKGKKGK